MSSNTTDKGTIGEFAIVTHLLELGYEVYRGVTGAEGIDLIAHKDERFIRVQVKSRVQNKNGAVQFPRISGGYREGRRLDGSEFDVMAMYVRDKKLCLFMNMKELLQNRAGVSVRIEAAKNGEKKRIRPYEEYISFERACGCSSVVERRVANA